MPHSYKYDLFISHSSKDKPLVRKLAAHLRQSGANIWFYEWMIKPGDHLAYAIEKGLEDSFALLLCMTPATFGSDWVTLELNTRLFKDPLNKDRKFIPLLLKDCKIPQTIAQYSYINARKIDEKVIKSIIDCIRRKLQKMKAITATELKAEGGSVKYELNEITGSNNNGRQNIKRLEIKKRIFDEISILSKKFQNKKIPSNLFYFDLDGFTVINKRFGWRIGNGIIKAISRILREEFGKNYTARWGADEFFCCLENSSEKQAFDLADHILSEIEKYSWEEITPGLFVTTSIDIASFKRKVFEEPAKWMERAILGSIYAKRLGGNTAKRGPVEPNPKKEKEIKRFVETYQLVYEKMYDRVEYLSDVYGS